MNRQQLFDELTVPNVQHARDMWKNSNYMRLSCLGTGFENPKQSMDPNRSENAALKSVGDIQVHACGHVAAHSVILVLNFWVLLSYRRTL